jgi:D-alanyl-D-alanine dipeptidase
MRALVCFSLLLPAVARAQSAADELVNVRELIPGVVIDLPYNTTGNSFHQKLYTTDECYLAHGAVHQLALVQDTLRTMGLGVKVWDGYRPRSVQYLMWEILPDPTYVADPATGSVHNRGGAIDLTLVDLSTGQELPMPTPFDWFGPEASHSWTIGLSADQIANRALLRSLMENVGGFSRYDSEWWHYTYDPSKSYPLLDFQLK